MVCHILCPECGKSLGEVYPLFIKLRELFFGKKYKNMKIHPHKLSLVPTENVGFILNSLQVNNFCCRTHILGTMDFDDIYQE
jgi:DNA-directed RNA polymerase subunit N (RpoN/RPB10)